jgi:starch phosphorylase
MSNTSDNHSLPQQFSGLADLAWNLWWCWNEEAQQLFEAIDPVQWELSGHNPVLMLRKLPDDRKASISHDPDIGRAYDEVMESFKSYLLETQDTVVGREYPKFADRQVAYISMEYGIHECLPIYAGGLGVLAGDHLKEASDMGLPLVGIGLLYRHGYLTQRIGANGKQEAFPADLELRDLPLRQVRGDSGEPVTISLDFPDRVIEARIWRIQVGRVPLFLLDTDVASNSAEDRSITSRLYPADLEQRISQEIVLGFGGPKALHRLGYDPAVWHMNEGHAAFLVLERMRVAIRQGSSYQIASKNTRATTVFTTHTPVPAGHDVFPDSMIASYLHGIWEEFGLTREAFLQLGTDHAPGSFSMPALAMRMSGKSNAVSKLHGEISGEIWSGLWLQGDQEPAPIGHITNGVHTSSWLGPQLRDLLNRYLAPDWWEQIDDPALWKRVDRIPGHELWRAHNAQKLKLLDQIGQRARSLAAERAFPPEHIAAMGERLNPDALTIGFARRFTSYKRPGLILSQPERLQSLLDQGVQIVFAGKAHPEDARGVAMIQEIYSLALRPEFAGRLAIIEGYDLALARLLVQGVDLWLNTPRRPNEASGTSGQKAALNGVLNCSILDGWWPEGFNGQNGWAFGTESQSDDPEILDRMDANSLYEILEEEIVPTFYSRVGGDDLPTQWIARMKESISTLGPQFCTRRMVREYVEQIYWD